MIFITSCIVNLDEKPKIQIIKKTNIIDSFKNSGLYKEINLTPIYSNCEINHTSDQINIIFSKDVDQNKIQSEELISGNIIFNALKYNNLSLCKKILNISLLNNCMNIIKKNLHSCEFDDFECKALISSDESYCLLYYDYNKIESCKDNVKIKMAVQINENYCDQIDLTENRYYCYNLIGKKKTREEFENEYCQDVGNYNNAFEKLNYFYCNQIKDRTLKQKCNSNFLKFFALDKSDDSFCNMINLSEIKTDCINLLDLKYYNEALIIDDCSKINTFQLKNKCQNKIKLKNNVKESILKNKYSYLDCGVYNDTNVKDICLFDKGRNFFDYKYCLNISNSEYKMACLGITKNTSYCKNVTSKIYREICFYKE